MTSIHKHIFKIFCTIDTIRTKLNRHTLIHTKDSNFVAEITIQLLTEYNKFGRIVGTVPGDFKPNFMIKPHQFLSYAESNLNEGTPHGLLDCLSNSKRAIECQVDSLLTYIGIYDVIKKKKYGFPSKIKVLNDVGIVSPRILTKVNKSRNLLEHSYQIPDKEKVEDAFDVAYLFVLSTERYLNIGTYSFSLECDCRFGEEIDTDLYPEQGKPTYGGFYEIILNPGPKTIYIEAHLWDWETNDPIELPDKQVSFESEEYYEYLRFFLKLYDLINVR